MIPTGTIGNTHPAAAIAGPPMTAVKAAAPPGGCRHRSSDIARMAPPTARPLAIAGDGTSAATATPTSAETTLPPITGQGWASGLAGTAKMSTADAPIGATRKIQADVWPTAIAVTSAVSAIPTAAPAQAASRSPNEAPAKIGANIYRTRLFLVDVTPLLQA